MNTRYRVAIVVLAVATMACQTREVKPFEPGITADMVIEVEGPLFPWPNPIIIPVADIGPEGMTCTMVEAMVFGSEPLTILGVEYEGSPGIGPSPYSNYDYPMELQGGGFQPDVCFYPNIGTPLEGALIFRTDDPTSPTQRVPVIVLPDPDAFLSVYENERFYYVHNSLHYFGSCQPQIDPNPIRISALDAGTSVTVTFTMYCSHNMSVTQVTASGPDVRLTDVAGWTNREWDGSLPLVFDRDAGSGAGLEIELHFDPITPMPSTEKLRITLVDLDRGTTYVLAVPIVID